MKSSSAKIVAGFSIGCSLLLAAGCGGGTSFDPCEGKSGLCQTQGQLRCSGDNQELQVCQKDSDGCLVWQLSEDCAAQQKTCDASGQSPQCVSQCQDNCGPLDTMRCQDNVIQRCQLAGSGCLDWVISQDCSSQGKACDDSVNPPVCVDCQSECTSGAIRCLGDVLQECQQVALSCFQWRQLEDCSATGAVCQDEIDPPGCVKPCQDNAGCDATEYCRKESCQAQAGFCEARPGPCSGEQDPVCGCDGVTYSNACEAARAGMNVDYAGACSTICHSNSECRAEEYCRLGSCAAETGVCRPRPTDCGNEWAPVCGCDGLSYPNDCYAARAGMSLSFYGLCYHERCFDNQLCGAAGYCRFEECHVGSGFCSPRPTTCPDVVNPVCGCDGNSYENECWANLDGVSVAYQGQCPNICSTNSDCAQGEFCLLETCNHKSGICQPRPAECSNEPDAVCGCDGKSYTNQCLAYHNGVNVDHPGACDAPGCRGNEDCQSAVLYCSKHRCLDESGWCIQRPNGCQLPVYAPVCGCDGVGYDNECQARLAGQNIDYLGKCEGDSCFTQDGCYAADLYCEFVPCAIETGKCRLRPQGCELGWEPVCGCDKITYASACIAGIFGASVDYAGECR